MRNPVLLSGLAAAAIFAAAPASADPASANDDAVTAARAVIERQIDAFLDNDMAEAYSYTSAAIKAAFPQQEQFADMIRRGYQPVYQPGNYAFGRGQELAGGTVIQELLIQGLDGDDWTALYLIERQDNGTMKISGVRIAPSALPQA